MYLTIGYNMFIVKQLDYSITSMELYLFLSLIYWNIVNIGF